MTAQPVVDVRPRLGWRKGREHPNWVPIETRFWSKVDFSNPDGCWLWTGSPGGTNGAYGAAWRDGKRVLAHRAAYEMVHGLLRPGLCVCHRCDSPKCVRPDHLFEGTQADNNHDMWAKGRGRGGGLSGEQHSMAKLTLTEVDVIRKSVEPQRVLARRYHVGQSQIWRIIHGLSWSSVPTQEQAAAEADAEAAEV